jgi:hypothetical protein
MVAGHIGTDGSDWTIDVGVMRFNCRGYWTALQLVTYVAVGFGQAGLAQTIGCRRLVMGRPLVEPLDILVIEEQPLLLLLLLMMSQILGAIGGPLPQNGLGR